MSLNHYEIKAFDLSLKFEFYSEGPKGRIKKKIVFKVVKDNLVVYNLGFGDVDDDGEINDIVISNNGDRQKVLNTVAFAVQKFLEKYPDYWVFSTGNTRARTRLYRMGITNNFDAVQKAFHVFGLIGETWKVFEKGQEYDAFLIRKKVNIFDI